MGRSLYGRDLSTSFSFRPDFSLRFASGGTPLDVGPGVVPEELERLWESSRRPAVEISRAHEGVVLRWATEAFHVTSSAVVVEADEPATAFERSFHPVMSVVLGMSGIATFHAFVAETDAGAVAIMGRSGYGKSSLGLALLERGAKLISDDMLAIDGAGKIQPGPRFVRITTDDRASRDPGGKRRQTVPYVDSPADLRAVIIITREAEGISVVSRQMEAVDALLNQAYVPFSCSKAEHRTKLERTIDLAANVPIYHCRRHHLDPDRLAERTMSILQGQ